MKTYFTFLLLNLSLLTAILSQPYLEWKSRFARINPLGNCNGNVIKVDNDENVYIAGKAAGLSNFDYLTIKLNPYGDTVWTIYGIGLGANIVAAIIIVIAK